MSLKNSYRLRPNKLQEDGQKHEAVEKTNHDDEQIHSEVVKFEDGRGGKGQHNNTDEFG